MSTPGKWGPQAASFLMKPLYAARVARPDIFVPIQQLASEITRWSAECDRRLHRLYCYMFSSMNMSLNGKLHYNDARFVLRFWPDADLCGNPFTARSTSGMWVELADSEGGFFPLMWGAHKQTAAASHTCEAETIAMASGLRSEVIAIQSLLSHIFAYRMPLEIYEDNSACIIAVNKGYSPAMRYLPRHQKISLAVLHELVAEKGKDNAITLLKVDTSLHKGDMFTKSLAAPSFCKALTRIGLS